MKQLVVGRIAIELERIFNAKDAESSQRTQRRNES